MTYSVYYHFSCVYLFQRSVFVATLDDCTDGTTWELLSLLRDVWGLSGQSTMKCQRNSPCCKLYWPRVVNVVSRLVAYKVPCGVARGRLRCFVFVNKQYSKVEHWTKKLLELKYIYPFYPPTPPFSVLLVLNTPAAFWTISTSSDLYKTTPLAPKHTR
jgi:hypothetical protein